MSWVYLWMASSTLWMLIFTFLAITTARVVPPGFAVVGSVAAVILGGLTVVGVQVALLEMISGLLMDLLGALS